VSARDSGAEAGFGQFATEYAHSAEELVELLRADPTPAPLGTLGPAGTSSHQALGHLEDRLASHGITDPFAVRLRPSFDVLLHDLTDGALRYALVPSAYQNATAFHWHPKVRLVFHYVYPTPAYGLVARPGEGVTSRPTVDVATVPEVRSLFHTLRPDSLGDRRVRWVDAESTVAAAASVARGAVDLALTNENGRSRFQLDWLSVRPGAHIVWLLFAHVPPAERQLR
jgi:hypothetical protein